MTGKGALPDLSSSEPSLIARRPEQQRSRWRIWLSRLEGPQTMGRGRGSGLVSGARRAGGGDLPAVRRRLDRRQRRLLPRLDLHGHGARGVWGYAGALSFGQTAFFGLAGYGYGVLTINFGAAYGFTFWRSCCRWPGGAALALVIGYFMFYGRIQGVFIGIVTLSVTLVFATFMAQTAGPEWAIGAARLNGFNGMSGMPPLTIPWPGGDMCCLCRHRPLYYVLLGLVLVVYLGLRMLLNAPFGNVLVAIRENPERAEMLGYDIRLYQLWPSPSAARWPGSRACSTPPGASTSRPPAWALPPRRCRSSGSRSAGARTSPPRCSARWSCSSLPVADHLRQPVRHRGDGGDPGPDGAVRARRDRAVDDALAFRRA
jgi:hypothetical protein